ncbi:MAG: DUF4932 domain-containing protein [Bacteroidota bacterium]
MKKSVLSLLFLLSLTATYAQPQNYDNYEVQIPPAFELANIMVALTDFGKADDNIVRKRTLYHEAVMDHFSPYTNHPAIRQLNILFSNNKGQNYRNYHHWRTGAYGALFEDDKLQFPLRISDNLFKKHRKLVEDFAQTSAFLKFYQKQKPLYQKYMDKYREVMPIKDMWQWMESQFPARYDSYKIVMSPLIYGYHNTFKMKGSKETVMVVDVPWTIMTDKEISVTNQASLVRVVLTEIDHNYVNPVSNASKKEIREALEPLECWNQNNPTYNSPISTFNEYMTWAVFSLYLREKYDNEVFEKVNESQARFMVERRGFVRFTDFNDYLLELYAKKQPHQKITDLYPQVIKWFSEQDCK